ncbi:YwmB family TATA-box binding protein [Paenibacillus montanisoli]|uniref:TATA-box binding protein n=1 Tax=Paenibacillus montanisoli TaxID=2081970 RepID=A0A328UAA1_9BACL|nr:YwmB family TATA-box binding protein [Paenibacillus montanisoli]RAP76966.1 hypothetical protein DL346_00190 [Paenibacillus montanisoli]
MSHYVPRSRTESDSFPSLRRQKRTPNWGIIIAALILLAAGCWTVYAGKTKSSNTAAGERLLHDFEAVYAWSGSEYIGGAEGAHWSFRWDGRADRKEAEQLAASLGFTLSSGLDEDEPVDIMAANDAERMKLWIHSRSDAFDPAGAKPYELILLLDLGAGSARSEMEEALGRIGRAAEDLDIRAGFTVRGAPIREGGAARLAEAASAQEVEAYDDGHTQSLTYFSKLLQSSVQSGDAKVNLQLAESAGAGGESSELIIGVPLITGDYTLQNN